MTDIHFDPACPIAIIGLGVMGTKVAWACARAGIPTRGFDEIADSAASAKERARSWGDADDKAAVARNLQIVGSLEDAVDGVQLAFENVPEVMDLKTRVLATIGRATPTDAYMGSNASSFTCTPLAQASGRPARFFNLNFTDPRTDRLVELMGGAETEPAAYDFAEAWARAIGMVPIRTRKEQMGYSFNRLWRAIKKEVLRQIAEGYADAESIDRAWMLTFGTQYGPCGMMDGVGLPSIAKVEQAYADDSGDPTDPPPQFLLDMIAAGKKGEISGEGFYSYPDPAYRRPGWLDGK